MALGSSLGQRPGDGVPVEVCRTALPAEQVQGQGCVPFLCEAAGHILDMRGQSSVFVADQDGRYGAVSIRAREVTTDVGSFGGELDCRRRHTCCSLRNGEGALGAGNRACSGGACSCSWCCRWI